MADKNSRLYLVMQNQANKENVINSLMNAMSPAAFGGLIPQSSNGLIWGIYGGYKNGALIPNSTVTLNDNTTLNYVYFDFATNTFKVSTTGFGDFPCYTVPTSGGIAGNWIDYRDLGGSGGSSGDPNFIGNGTPTTAPKATQTDAIAIGSGSEGNGNNSFAAMSGKASGQGAIAFGQSNTTNSNFAISFGGSGNATQAQRSVIISGNDNTINAQSNYNCILSSYSSTITSSAFDYNTIIGSNQSSIASNNSMVLNGAQSYIENDGQYATLIGYNGKIDVPFTYQYSFTNKIKHQKTALTRETTGTSETPLQLGNGIANVKNFKIRDNQVVNIVITMMGTTSSGNVILFKDEVLVKRFSSVTEFVAESSTTEKSLTVTKSSTALSATTARIIVSGNDIIIGVTPNVTDSIQWSCEFDMVICER